jgi:hypothetical protein
MSKVIIQPFEPASTNFLAMSSSVQRTCLPFAWSPCRCHFLPRRRATRAWPRPSLPLAFGLSVVFEQPIEEIFQYEGE